MKRDSSGGMKNEGGVCDPIQTNFFFSLLLSYRSVWYFAPFYELDSWNRLESEKQILSSTKPRCQITD